MSIRHLHSLLRPQAVVQIGEALEPGVRQMVEGLRGSPNLLRVPAGGELAELPRVKRWVALVAEAATVDPALVRRLGERGCQALLWPLSAAPSTELLQETRRQGIRLLGPRSGGVLRPAAAYQAATFPGRAGEGGLALIAQSQSVAAAALDWAAGRKLGFSWMVVSGAEADVDVADLLDYAALDPQTRGVAVQLSSLRGGRKFMSAARACARVKPVVVLQTQPASRIGRGPDPVRSAAFARAGLVECESLPGLFDALTALHRLPALQRPEVVMVGNGAGICALGVDALARQGVGVLAPPPEQRARLPDFRDAGGALDLGNLDQDGIAATVRALLADPQLPALLLVHSPAGGSSHEGLADRLLADADPRLLTVWLGLDSALAARRRCTEAGLATFTSADAAARALRYRWEHHRNRELLTQTPPPHRIGVTDPAELRRELRQWALNGEPQLRPAVLARLLDEYGVAASHPGAGPVLELLMLQHPELGQYLQLARAGAVPAFAFAPLDALLAGRLVDQAGIASGGRVRDHLVRTLVQLAQLLIDQPSLGSLRLLLQLERDGVGWLAEGTEAWLRMDTIPERQRLVLAPYPEQLSGALVDRDGGRYRYRPVRPPDEPALIALLQRLDPEEVRLRFFVALRHFSHAMGARMSQIDYDRELSLVLTPEGRDEVVAIATLVADPDNTEAEFALLVHHDHAGRGLGRSLLQLLIDEAWRRGIGCVHGVVLAENAAMLAASARLGFRRRPEPDDPGCVRVEIHRPD